MLKAFLHRALVISRRNLCSSLPALGANDFQEEPFQEGPLLQPWLAMSRAEAPRTTTVCLLPDVTLKAVGLAVYSGNLSKRVVGAADFQKGVPMFFCGAACLHSLDFLGLFLSLTGCPGFGLQQVTRRAGVYSSSKSNCQTSPIERR